MEPDLSIAETLRRNPYRIFFPLGIVAGLLGVGHWVLWTIGIPVESIKLLHMTLQSQGFLTFFVIGFLMTAFPRFSGTDSATIAEMAAAFIGSLIFLTGELSRNWALSQTGFLITVAIIPVFAGRRLANRTKDLPPSFLLLGFGLVQAFLGGFFSLASHMGDTNLYLFSVGRQMVQIGFLLCMVLGVTAKLAPFLMGYTAEPSSKNAASKNEIIVHGIVGASILGSFFAEPIFPRMAMGLRAVLATLHLLWFAKIGRPLKKTTATIVFFWVSCWMIPIGLWLAFLLPAYRIAAVHVIFIGGFSLMIFSFGMLVVLSHSGKAALLNGKLWVLKSACTMALLALGFRLAADFFPEHYMVFLHSAGGFWVVAGTLWLGYAVPKMKGAHHEH
jgi:uncharacterized protein involved in response to NO